MHTTLTHGAAARATAVVILLGFAGLGLTACQTVGTFPTEPPAEAPRSWFVDGQMAERYSARPADRIEEEIAREVARGLRPSPDCTRHVVVEHPDGGYHLVCAVARAE